MRKISHSSWPAKSSGCPHSFSVIGPSACRSLAWQAAVAAALLLAGAQSHAGTWDHPRGNAANTGFADVTTAPATAPLHTVPGLGIFAPDAGPVIGPDGTAYVGNFHGELRAIRSDGSQAWKRTLLRGQSIIASPVIGADGSIYVVGTAWPLIRDHVGGGQFRRYDTTLYRFSSNGAMQWSTNFPKATPGSSGTGAAPAAPNIWRSGEIEVIIVPARYDTDAGRDVHLTTFSSNGALLFDHFVTRSPYPGVTVGCYPWVCGVGFDASDPAIQVAMRELGPPLPSVAMVARSGAPEVVVADGYQYVVGYTLSPATGFQEIFRKHITNDERGIGMTSPVILRDGHSVLGGWTDIGERGQAWLLFAGPHPNNMPEIVLEDATLIPSLTADGRITWRRPGSRRGGPIRGSRVPWSHRCDRQYIRCTSNELAEPCHHFARERVAHLRREHLPARRVLRVARRRSLVARDRRRRAGLCHGRRDAVRVPGAALPDAPRVPGRGHGPRRQCRVSPANPFSNQVTSPVFQTTPAWSGGGLSQPGVAPK